MTLGRKMLRVGLVLVGLVVVASIVALGVTTIRPARAIGVQQTTVADPGHPPLAVTILYPTTDRPGWSWLGLSGAMLATDGAIDGRGLPLILMSHGTGGTATSHIDTMLALAEAGYVVAAPLHTGDNFADDSSVGTGDWMVDRARHVARVSDHMSGKWAGRDRLDPARVGLFGYSAGGTTALISIGGTPDFARVAPHCATTPELVCRLSNNGAALGTQPASAWNRDRRVRAAVIVAPGFGFTFAPDGLSAVRVPVQLWAGGADRNVPLASNAQVVRRLLARPPEFHLVTGAEHFSFMPPCGLLSPLLPPMLCRDPKGFDRAAFHRSFNRDVVRFFDDRLR